LCIFNLALPHEKIISELQAQNPKLMKHSLIRYSIQVLADFIKYTNTKMTAKFELVS
jgi:hypothetical protein